MKNKNIQQHEKHYKKRIITTNNDNGDNKWLHSMDISPQKHGILNKNKRKTEKLEHGNLHTDKGWR